MMDLLYDKLENLWSLIDRQHLVCLETEAQPDSDHRRRLENYMKDYLCLAPHERKFRFPQTAEVLHSTVIVADSNFDPSRTTKAWRAIARYADNLIVQPWRKEFRDIKLYCGFYKHIVEKGLIGAEKLLEIMGYYPSSMHLATMTMQGVIDPDRITGVSKDAILALVEVQIMRHIHESMESRHPVTWTEILSFRENHPGSPDQAVKTLNYRSRQRAFHEQQCRRSSYTQNCYNYVPSYPYPSYELKPHDFYPTNGYHPHNGYPAATVPAPTLFPAPVTYHSQRQCVVPTGRLIELESPPHHSARNFFPRDAPSSKAKEDGAGSWEQWDLVYKNFENQGYRKEGFKNRHVIEGHGYPREEVSESLRHDDSEVVRRTKKDVECTDEKRRSRRGKSDERQDLKPDLAEAIKKVSLDSFESAESVVSSKSETGKKRTEGDGEDERKHFEKDEVDAPKSVLKDTSSIPEGPCTVKLPPEKGTWECVTCTFLNAPDRNICEMCSKSRFRGDDVPQPCGGLECRACTFVNEPGSSSCSLCNSPLTNASTYI